MTGSVSGVNATATASGAVTGTGATTGAGAGATTGAGTGAGVKRPRTFAVLRSRLPVALRPTTFWNDRKVARVRGLNLPSAPPTSVKPFFSRADCINLTVSLVSPNFGNRTLWARTGAGVAEDVVAKAPLTPNVEIAMVAAKPTVRVLIAEV